MDFRLCGEIWRDLARCGDIWGDIGEIWGNVARSGEMWGDLARCGEMWDVARGWPVPHLVLDYVAAILDFVQLFIILVTNARKCAFGGVDRFSIDFRYIVDRCSIDF